MLNHRAKIEGFDVLKELALNLRWSWHHGADKVWEELDPELWHLTHNPWIVLQTVSKDKLEKSLADPAFCKIMNELVETNRHEASTPAWFQKKHSKAPLTKVAYFSMEYMITEGLPIYSGGLGNVAGDQLKAASDLGVPVVAIGLLYQQGYFRQMFDRNGAQQALYPFNDPGQLPVTPLRKPNGEWLRLEVIMPGYSVWVRAWEVQAGRVKLYLLDSNDAANFPAYRAITSELYGGGPELRLKQEIILGIGGWRLLETLGIEPEVCHLNEGHAAFAVLERAYSFMKKTGVTFEAALAATRAGNLFTTHTAVPAGFDRFSATLIKEFLTNYAEQRLNISMKDFLALGRVNADDEQEPFNMAYLAIRGCGQINGVSRLHGAVSRQIFSPLFPRWSEDEVPIGHVTNGVHVPSWDCEESDRLWTEVCGQKRWLEATETMENKIYEVQEEKIWEMRKAARGSFVEFIRKRYSQQLSAVGESRDVIEQAKHYFDPETLTLGFARRFATYKRPNMLLSNPERLLRILTNTKRPVQLVLAGKAHPADLPGQALIKQWNDFIRKAKVNHHVIFLSDYDMLLTEQLVKGVDVWINTPRRPWEACGTSGMKILVNGGLNLSELDGWWAEAYTPDVGWAIGDGQEHGDDPSWDASEASSLYDLLEREVIPLFYERDEKGIPSGWIKKIRYSMARLTPQFSSNRAVREYTETYYLPAASNYRERTKDCAATSLKIVQWEKDVKAHWEGIKFEGIKVQTAGDKHTIDVQVYLDGIGPDELKVELFLAGLNGDSYSKYDMQCLNATPDGKTYAYRASVSSKRPANHYTPRIVPRFKNVAVPLEINQILWQH